MSTIPLIGKAYDEILEEMASFRSKDADFFKRAHLVPGVPFKP